MPVELVVLFTILFLMPLEALSQITMETQQLGLTQLKQATFMKLVAARHIFA